MSKMKCGNRHRLAVLAGAIVLMQGCGGGSGPAPAAAAKIRHVVIVFQENRTPDNLFHGLRGADIANSGVNSSGQTIPLTPQPLANDYDLGHAHSMFKRMYDDGRMDGADLVSVKCNSGASNCPPPNAQFKYVDPGDVAPYFELAQRYTFGDRMFQTNQGPSFPAHQYIIAGTSQASASSLLFASENPTDTTTGVNGEAGCAAPSTSMVELIDPSGSEAHKQYPCFEHETLTDLLDQAMVSWKYYAPSAGSIWTGPNAIQHIRGGPGWANVIIPESQVLSDIQNGRLAQVSWITPTGQASDHASSNDGTGPSWVAAIVNAIGNSPYWSDTAIFVTWDDWGGWYDHVPPPAIFNQYEYGFRVPLIVISPYAKSGYVSHVTHDFGSILRFIEVAFGLPSLGYADARADDLADCFDFKQAPLVFMTVSSSVDAGYFERQESPPSAARTDPDDE